jgi:hypothetical protein
MREVRTLFLNPKTREKSWPTIRIWAKGAVIDNSARKMRRYMRRFS